MAGVAHDQVVAPELAQRHGYVRVAGGQRLARHLPRRRLTVDRHRAARAAAFRAWLEVVGVAPAA